MTTTTTSQTAPKIVKWPSASRGRTQLGWLDSRHSFSFGSYFDPDRMGYRTLRVINDDVVQPGQGFGTHPHKDTEIFSYVVDGALEHRDSMGNGSVIAKGNLQYMSAGRGVFHSEFNPSASRPVRFLQVWIMPNQTGGQPRYAEKTLGGAARANALTLLFSGRDNPDAVQIRQDAEVYFGKLAAGRSLEFTHDPGRGLYLHVIHGQLSAAGEELVAGDGAGIDGASAVTLAARGDAEFLLFSLA